MEGFCRACLVNYDQPKDLLQYIEKNRRLYVYSTGIQVKRNDAFPLQLCKDCYMKMKVSCNFKKLCRTSDKNIRNYQSLKEAGDDVDFVTFMRKIESSLAFKFPLSGHSTPAINKTKDDDNVSTTTSIRNFMRDILQPEEIPDSEVQIIRQIIEDEADILDDSLDSQWLQDDVSLDSNFQLGLSFIPFTTSKHNSFNTPKANDTSQSSLPDISKLLEFESPVKNEAQQLTNDTEDNQPTEPSVCYAERMIEDVKKDNDPLNFNSCNVGNGMRCVIDKNLDRALQCDDKSEFALDDLLATPAGSTVSISTNSINNLLFGNKENNNQRNRFTEIDCLDDENGEIYDQMNVLDDFYDDQHSNDDDKSDILEPDNIEDKYDKINFICKLCNNKKFKDDRCLSIHFVKQHKISIKNKFKKEPKKTQICVTCGKAFQDRRNLARHLKNVHSEKVVPKCEKCGQIFKNEYCLKAHMQTHNIFDVATKKRKHTCDFCGKSYTTGYTLNLHIRGVHEKKPRMTCNECGKGFQRKIDLITHLRTHSGEKPWQCLYCDKSYARRDALSRHIKCHLEDHQDKRYFHKKKFENVKDLKEYEKKLKIEKAKKLREKKAQDIKDASNTSEKTDNKRIHILQDIKLNNIGYQAATKGNQLSPSTQFYVVRPKDIETLKVTDKSDNSTNASDANMEPIDNAEKSKPYLDVIAEIDNQMHIEADLNPENQVIAMNQEQNVSEVGKKDMTVEEANDFIRQIVPAANLSMPVLM